MKRILVISVTIATLAGTVAAGGIVNNSTVAVTSEDSISFVFCNLDSLGQSIGGLDSTVVLVLNPSGDSVFGQVITGISNGVRRHTVSGDTAYSWSALVADIDGTGQPGVYSVLITAVSDHTGGQLRTPFRDFFQVAGWKLAAMGNGAGQYACTFVVRDSATMTPIPYAGLSVRNLSQSAQIASGRTDSEGLVTFNLDADSFVVLASATGYVFCGGDTVAVTSSEMDTIYGCSFDPGSPSLPGLCRVYGFLYDVKGEPLAEIAVSASLPSGVSRSGATVISPFRVSTVTDSLGHFFLDLIPSADLVPSSTAYEITIGSREGTILRKRLAVPSESSWQVTW
jgi:hypothetical protein